MKKRIGWIDSLRGIAMFFVIFGHAFYRRNNKIRNYIYSFHMPLFFFISGLTTKRSGMTLLQFLKKKCKDLLLPYLALNVFVFINNTSDGIWNVFNPHFENKCWIYY